MIEVKVAGKLRQLPQNWDEIKALPWLHNEAMKLFGQDLSPDVFILRLSLTALRIPLRKWKLIAPDTAALLIEAGHWMVDSFIGGIEEIRFAKLAGLYGPRNFFDHLATWEFAVAERHFIATPYNPDELDKFIAALYRPRRFFSKKNGDIRTEFNDTTYLKRIKKIKAEPAWKKHQIWQWFLQQREAAITLHPHIWPQTQSDPKPDAEASWIDTIIAISKPGDEDTTAQISIGLMLRRLELNAKEVAQTRKKATPTDDN